MDAPNRVAEWAIRLPLVFLLGVSGVGFAAFLLFQMGLVPGHPLLIGTKEDPFASMISSEVQRLSLLSAAAVVAFYLGNALAPQLDL